MTTGVGRASKAVKPALSGPRFGGPVLRQGLNGVTDDDSISGDHRDRLGCSYGGRLQHVPWRRLPAAATHASCGAADRPGHPDTAPAAGGVQPTTPATDTAALQPALEGVIQPTPAGAAPAASSVELTRPDVLGSWTVAAAGDSCQLTMVLTTWTGGYRASTRGCSNEALTGISAWNLEGNQVQLMNDSGATVARLYPASLTQFNGQTEGGGPISVSR